MSDSFSLRQKFSFSDYILAQEGLQVERRFVESRGLICIAPFFFLFLEIVL